jgi:hypothetical protein
MNKLLPIIAAALLLPAAAAAHTATWASKDRHYLPTDSLPAALTADTTLQAWRGERIGALALIQADATEAISAKAKGKFQCAAAPVDYVITDNFRACGVHPSDRTPYEVPDIINSAASAVPAKAGQLTPVWVTVEVPQSARPGTYVHTVEIAGERLTLRIQVQDRALPTPAAQAFHLNLWQQPYAVSRYYGVEPWSAAHFEHLKPYAQMLARAGQRTISTILFFEPWGEQSNDLFQPMVQTTRHADGSWSYDYGVFDRWVEFMDSYGVGPLIECFTMIPWEMNFRYFDEATGDYAFLKTTTDAAEYRDLWSDFLRSFGAHLRQKGWFDRTAISMDERALPDMLNALQIIRDTEPQLKVSLAGNYHPEIIDQLHTCSIQLGDPIPADVIERRRSNGQVSTLYTCCTLPEPNLFSNNAPADAAWLPLYCTSTGYDGYLHWSWMNWTDDPMHDSRFKLFAPGDTYFIYPDGCSSVRFERLIEGIQLSEKVRLLRQECINIGDAASLARLEDALNPIRSQQLSRYVTTASQVARLTAVVNELSRSSK